MVNIGRITNFKGGRNVKAEWNTFRKGLNLLLRPTEINNDEYVQGDNIMLIGSGVPTGRWGTEKYFTANSHGTIRGFATYVKNATNEIIALSDAGYLAKKSGLSYSVITGISYPSGSQIDAEQLGGKTYIVSENVPMVVYNGTNIQVFATLSAPTALQATNISGVSGTNVYSWTVTATSVTGGETQPSVRVQLNNLPQDLSKTTIRLSWTGISAATFTGYQIYRGRPGDETFLAAVGPSTTQYFDMGDPASLTQLPPLTNSTGGIKSPFIKKINDRLIAVDANDRTKLLISARYPKHYSFSWVDGGGYLYVDPDSGEDIVGAEIQPGSNKILVYKENSHYEVTLSTTTFGPYLLLDPVYQPISTDIGCSSGDTIQVVENDVFYFGRKGIYVTGYEPNFLSVIRTNEISARVRPYLAQFSDDDYKSACAMYVNNKYLLSFPGRREILVYDRERGCFAGIWKLPFGISKMKKHVDSSGTERWILGSSENNQVYIFEPSKNSDDGKVMIKNFRTNKEVFGSFDALKIAGMFHMILRNMKESTTINILLEDREGRTVNAKTFTIEGTQLAGNSGWGYDLWGTQKWGDTSGTYTPGGDEVYRWGHLFKECQSIQYEVKTSTVGANFELLGILTYGKIQGKGSVTSSQQV
jgi:hypothetical protein